MLPTRTHDSSPASTQAAEDALEGTERRTHVAVMARAILPHALLLGVAADLLLRDGLAGLGLPVWIALLALTALALAWTDGRRLSGEAAGWLVTALLFASAMAWRAAEGLQVFDFLATLFALGMTAIAIADRRAALFAPRMRDTAVAAVRTVASIAGGIVPLALRDAAFADTRGEFDGRVRPVMRAVMIALPLLLLFGSLLRSADPVFASLVAFPDIDVDVVASHFVLGGFFAWIVAGWARAALLRPSIGAPVAIELPVRLGRLDLTAALGTLNALFALYVLTQLGWFFGGERFLQARTGLTAAEYARQGFFQMVWVVLLVLPLLLASRAMLRRDRSLERRHTALATPLLVLLGLMVASAVLRMRLYVHYYGLTLERFYPLVLMGWLAIVLLWLGLTVLRARDRHFAAGAVISALVVLGMLNIVVPDVIVARVNVARAQRQADAAEPTLDLRHLATLGGEAVPITLTALLEPAKEPGDSASALRIARDRCGAARTLLGRWGPSGRELARHESSDAPWRLWNAGVVGAVRAARDHHRALLSVQHDACARVRALAPAGTTARAR
jgi:hypothetical protein